MKNINHIPKCSFSAAFEIWSHFLQTLDVIVEAYKEDEDFLVQFQTFMIDGEYRNANNMLFGLNESQISLIPIMIREFLKSYTSPQRLAEKEIFVDCIQPAEEI
jgi:hypothetical protein